jgi:hypothetical protein
MCQHLHTCPDAQAPDRMAARVVADHLEQGWSLRPSRIDMAPAAGGVLRAGMMRMMSGG